MARFEGRFVSVVLLGRQNVQILNHDFLMANDVLPAEREPFRGLLAKEEGQPFTQFVSVPIMATLSYGPISITVEENRYQIRDDRFDDPVSSPIFDITKQYFGLLRYTPFELGGINLNGTVSFDDCADEERFDEAMGVKRERVHEIWRSMEGRVGMTQSFAWRRGVVEVQLPKAKAADLRGTVNFNYEFRYEDIDAFLGNLDDVGPVYRRFTEFLGAVGLEVH